MEVTDYKIADKKANTDHEILPLLSDRYSPRVFADTEVDEAVLNRLFEAMRWAPSSMNEQPWRIIYAHRGERAHELIAETLNSGNKLWAVKAPVLMLTLIKKTLGNGAPNVSAHHDLGMAMGNLAAQATYENLGLHFMGGFSADEARALFHIPDDYEPVTAVALGHFGNPDDLPEGLRKRELAARTRKPIAEFAFHASFNPMKSTSYT